MKKHLVGRWYTVIAIAGVLAVALVAGGCGGAARKGQEGGGTDAKNTSAFNVTITDDAGRRVTLTKKPERIVSLAPANTEIVYALGIEDRLVGVTTYDDYPPEVAKIAKVGDFTTPNLEAIAAADLDLVLATTGVQAEVIKKLEDLGAKVVALDPASVEGVRAAVNKVGYLCDTPDKAETVVARMDVDLQQLAKKLEGRKPVSCFVEIAQEPLFTAGNGTLIADLVSKAGGRNVVTEKGYVAYSVEQLVKDSPDVYLVTKGSMSDPKALNKRAGYSKLQCIKDGRVFVLDDNLVSRPGPRIAQGAEQIAKALHPDAFKD